MKINYNVDVIKKILSDLTCLTGIEFSFLDKELNLICSSKTDNNFCTFIHGNPTCLELCKHCDNLLLERCKRNNNFEDHICHAGLYDAIFPIIKNGVFAGTILMGRIRSQQSPKLPNNITGKKEISLYKKTPYLNNSQIASFQSLLPNILFEESISYEYNDYMDKITDFINRNLDKDLRIYKISSEFHISKNTLYNLFSKHYGKTVNSYITDCRLALAKKLLRETDMTVNNISDKLGLGECSYFCNMFKKHTGLSPTQFRHIHSK